MPTPSAKKSFPSDDQQDLPSWQDFARDAAKADERWAKPEQTDSWAELYIKGQREKRTDATRDRISEQPSQAKWPPPRATYGHEPRKP